MTTVTEQVGPRVQVVSVFVIAVTSIKFEFTNDANFQLFAGEYIYGKMYVRTDRKTDKHGSRFTRIWEAHSGLPQLIPPKLLQHNQLSVTLK